MYHQPFSENCQTFLSAISSSLPNYPYIIHLYYTFLLSHNSYINLFSLYILQVHAVDVNHDASPSEKLQETS